MTAAAAVKSLPRAEKVARIGRVRAERPDLTGRQQAALIGMTYGAFRNLCDDPDGAKQARATHIYAARIAA